MSNPKSKKTKNLLFILCIVILQILYPSAVVFYDQTFLSGLPMVGLVGVLLSAPYANDKTDLNLIRLLWLACVVVHLYQCWKNSKGSISQIMFFQGIISAISIQLL